MSRQASFKEWRQGRIGLINTVMCIVMCWHHNNVGREVVRSDMWVDQGTAAVLTYLGARQWTACFHQDFSTAPWKVLIPVQPGLLSCLLLAQMVLYWAVNGIYNLYILLKFSLVGLCVFTCDPLITSDVMWESLSVKNVMNQQWYSISGRLSKQAAGYVNVWEQTLGS